MIYRVEFAAPFGLPRAPKNHTWISGPFITPEAATAFLETRIAFYAAKGIVIEGRVSSHW